MEYIIGWFNQYWWAAIILMSLAMKVLRLITKHFSEYDGIVRWCLFLVDLLDIFKSTPPPAQS